MRVAVAVAVLVYTASATVSLQRSDSRGVVLRYEPGAPSMTTASDGTAEIEFPGADRVALPGEADLPCRVERVGIPQTGGVRVRVSRGPEHRLDGVVIGTATAVSNQGLERSEMPTGLKSLPASDVVVSEPEVLRQVRFVEVRLHPALYDSGAKRLTYHEWLEVELDFENLPSPRVAPDPLDGCMTRMLVNGDQALAWKVQRRPEDGRGGGGFYGRASQWVKIEVDRPGVYGLTGAGLDSAGVRLAGVDPQTISLFTVGEHAINGPYPDTLQEVAILVEGEADGVLDPEDRIIFYGVGADHWDAGGATYARNPYTGRNVYWLCWGMQSGRRMSRGLGPDTTGARRVHTGRVRLHQEQDRECPARSGLLWLWRSITKDVHREEARFEVELALDHPVSVDSISGRMYTNPNSSDHTVVMRLNRRTVDTLRFGTSGPYTPFNFAVRAGIPARLTHNRLVVALLGEGWKSIYLDFLEVSYTRRLSLFGGQLRYFWDEPGRFLFTVGNTTGRPLVLDVTDPLDPRMQDGVEVFEDSVRFCWDVRRPAEFVVSGYDQLLAPAAVSRRTPGGLSSAAAQADFWIVTPGESRAAAERLARRRDGNIPGIAGARARAATLDDVYDDYAWGLEEPGAIREFLRDKMAPYGLLIGDATYDYRGGLGRPRYPGVPAFEVGLSLDPSGCSNREAMALDAWYADFDGSGGSPDMILARITTRSGAELGRFVDKLVRYETSSPGSWTKRFVLMADDEYEGEPRRPDRVGFKHMDQGTEPMGARAGNLLELIKVYLTEYPYVGFGHKPGANAELMRQLKRGALLFLFFGHGDAFSLTHEVVLAISEVAGITNDYRSPFCYFGSCSVGRFDDTRYECIAEEMVRMPDGGAIAAVGATKATTAGTNGVFATNMIVPLFAGPDSAIGTFFYQAWPTDRLYHLFGDPTMVLRVPERFTPDLVVQPDTLRPGSGFAAQSAGGLPDGEYFWTLFGPRRARTYRSDRGTANYTLSGDELGRGRGGVRNGVLFCQGTFPVGVVLDTVRVGNGWYAPLPRSCRLSATVRAGSGDLISYRDTIGFASGQTESEDRDGPGVALMLDGQVLADGMTVPKEFVVEGVVEDRSGILIAPVPGASPRFFLSSGGTDIELADLFSFEDSAGSRARFRVAVNVDAESDTLHAIAYDNLLNRTIASVGVLTQLEEPRLEVDSVLVFPNPVENRCWFTFQCSRSAVAGIRIYSLKGRLVRDLGRFPIAPGYNQLEWDGRGAEGRVPANGVYLFALTVESTGTAGPETVRVNDRLLVMR